MPAEFLVDPAILDPSRVILDRAHLERILPHRGAMALLDGVCYDDPEGGIMAGWKDVRADEFWAPGHFPGHPILPGVVLVEAAAQVSLVKYKRAVPEVSDKLVVFGGIDNARFRGAVRPGDRVFVITQALELSRRGARCACQAAVNGKLVFEGEIFAVATQGSSAAGRP